MIMDERLEFADATALDTTGTNVDLIAWVDGFARRRQLRWYGGGFMPPPISFIKDIIYAPSCFSRRVF